MVVSRIYGRDGVPVPAAEQHRFPDVEGLFLMIANALEEQVDFLSVTYDPILGYPVRITIDPGFVIDDDRTTRVSEFSPL